MTVKNKGKICIVQAKVPRSSSSVVQSATALDRTMRQFCIRPYHVAVDCIRPYHAAVDCIRLYHAADVGEMNCDYVGCNTSKSNGYMFLDACSVKLIIGT